MAAELAKLGVDVEERPDGLVVRGRAAGGRCGGGTPPQRGEPEYPQSGDGGGGETSPPVKLDGHGDHRVVMALAALALGAGPAEISGAESAAVTYPGFLELLDADMIE
jgi:3-phosphoshikimate 1-carboxyvinyltransferase